MKRFMLPVLVIVLISTGFILWNISEYPSSPTWASVNWQEYQGGPERNQYSALTQITPENVHELEVAWEYHTGVFGEMQTNPIIIDGTLYAMTADTQPFALNAATGEEYWRREVPEDERSLSISRGVVYWEAGDDKRILFTNGEWLYAVDARTGEPVLSFGVEGRTSLKAGLGETAIDKFVGSTSPGTVFNDLIIMPLRVSEGHDAAPGHIQAFNIKTGALEWVFHTIPHPDEYGYDTWPEEAYKNKGVGGANNWAGMAIDRNRGIVYVPTGSAAFDFYGANRLGQNLFANTLLALDAKTGERIWHYQIVQGDILDRDLPAPPNLITLNRNGKQIDAVAQITKQGYVFVFDRETGEPLFPIEDRPVPASDVPGEIAWPTQPFPTKPKPYARQYLTEDDISPYAENREELEEIFRDSRSEGPFTPLSEQGTIVFPGLDGGAEWGGAAVDPKGIIYINSNEMAWHIALSPATTEEELAGLSLGARVYTLYCAACHGSGLSGNPASGFPSLINLSGHTTPEEVTRVVSGGQGMMPAFSYISDQEMQAVVDYLFRDGEYESEVNNEPFDSSIPEITYNISGYTKFLDRNGLPGISPPWGTLNAIDLNTGEFVWKINYGEYPELMEQGHPQTGAESYGGPVVTASGLLFIAGTKDGKFRAYDKTNGNLLWETQLPAAAFATPSTYEADGKQYIVLPCGGTKLGAESGDSYVAFALPD